MKAFPGDAVAKVYGRRDATGDLGYHEGAMTARASAYEAKLSARGDEPAFNEDGVDLTQIRRFLALTPLERLVWVEQTAVELEALRSIARVTGPADRKR